MTIWYFCNQPITHLYHYTTIETLALILKNRTIRFNSLNNVDDCEEKKVKDDKPFGQYGFVSCWTPEATESIPMWHIYCKDMKGVRIKLPIFPFAEYILQSGEPSFVKNEMVYNQSYLTYPAHKNELFFGPVQYSDDENMLNRKIGNDTGIAFDGLFAMCKRTAWSFQKECRYRLIALPAPLYDENGIRNSGPTILEKARECSPLGFEFIDLDIDPLVFSKMEITMAPKIAQSSGESEIVQAFCEKYHIENGPSYSDLLGKIKI